MPDFMRLVLSLSQSMNAELTRSDVLRALIWPIAALLLSLTAGGIAHSPTWLLAILALALVAFVAIYVFTFAYCLTRDPDLLRSEKYKLHKMAIEQGLIGDSATGLIDPSKPESKGLLEGGKAVE